jgi:Mitochondrial K+-H+ exchange-related
MAGTVWCIDQMLRTLDLYLIPARSGRYLLFAPSDVVEQCELESGDRIRKSIEWVKARPNRFVAWVGRVLQSAHAYYNKLEDRIDPMERVLKAIGASGDLVVHHQVEIDGIVRSQFRNVLRKQRLKHTFWLCVDGLITAGVVTLTPVLAPIPGPNVFFYYPALRLLSHYRAWRGASMALGSMPVQFKSLRDFVGLEENLPGLGHFLRRGSA